MLDVVTVSDILKCYKPEPSEGDDALLSSNYERYGSLKIEMSDQGPGMTEEQLGRLFGEGVQFNPNQLQSGQGNACNMRYLYL